MADNDAGVVIMPGGKVLYRRFVTDSNETDENAAIIAHISRMVYDRNEVGKSGEVHRFAIVFMVAVLSIPLRKGVLKGDVMS